MAKYKIKCKLTGTDGNAFALMGKVSKALREGLRKEGKESIEITQIISEFRKEAMSGDYNNLLNTCMHYVEVK